ncbi:hypothetical protein [Stutzerimonas nitrititolerans]|uniref:hypothetical protein n=1 Tax=Stutzerimonas nitrititolerans TaxID=2482751 RepID=UPI00289FFA49|nr:hypothetical protein [Stutzerimonas nitrititolerans]
MNPNIPFNVNTVYLITSSRPGEEGTTRRLEESISDVSNNGGNFNFSHARLHSGDGYFQLLEEIFYGIDEGLRPIVHFDMHGSQERGLEIGRTGEFIDWESVVDSLRVINTKLNNELVVLITACHGLHAILPISFEKTAPFLCLIAPEEEVKVGHIEERVPEFYRELFSSGSLAHASQKLGKEFKYFHSAEFLFRTLSRYIKEKCKGAGGQQRREDLLTEIMETRLGEFPEKISEYRSKVKQHVAPNQELLDRYTSRFLLGKASNIKIDDLLNEIEKSYL